MGRGPVGRVLAWGPSSQTCLKGGQPRRTDCVSGALRGKGRVAACLRSRRQARPRAAGHCLWECPLTLSEAGGLNVLTLGCTSEP